MEGEGSALRRRQQASKRGPAIPEAFLENKVREGEAVAGDGGGCYWLFKSTLRLLKKKKSGGVGGAEQNKTPQLNNGDP